MFNTSGKCKCGVVTFSLELPEILEKYSPRACDCDFCTHHNLAYLSHPEGTLNICNQDDFKIVKQGSEQAKFLSCDNCGDVIGAVYQFDNTLKGAVNANLLEESDKLQKPTVISPKLLEPDEKLERWNNLWLKVKVNNTDHL